MAGGLLFLRKDVLETDSPGLAGFSQILENIGSTVSFSGEREWTDVSGRKITGTFVAGTDEVALIRVAPKNKIFRIPLSRLSEADRDYARTRSQTEELFNGKYPAVPNRWPQVVEGRHQPLNLKKESDSYDWTTTNYEFRPTGEIAPEVAERLAVTCEAVDVALMNTPLPLLWGRDTDRKRVIRIYLSKTDFRESGSQENWGAYYNPNTNEVHVPLSSLNLSESTPILSQFSLRKRDDYQILVHELVHQATVSFLVLGLPAWVGEGTAELFSALQTSPGHFNFINHQAKIRTYISEQIVDPEGVLQLQTLPLPKLESFFDLKLRDFNQQTGESANGGLCEYAASLLLTEYFCYGDGNSMRNYLEAVFTRVSPREAAELHLLRGRSPAVIEALIIERWAKMGITIAFVNNPEVTIEDIRGNIGL